MQQHKKCSKGPVAVIDIGSNTVRLVIYSGIESNPSQIFTTREFCELGRGQNEDRTLNPSARSFAFETIERFIEISRSKSITNIEAFATSAVRCAEDGISFTHEIQNSTGILPVILSGEEEAELAALGVLSAFSNAEGIVADFGGGSLELACISKGQPTDLCSLPFGTLSYGAKWRNGPHKVNEKLRKDLGECDRLTQMTEPALYLVGGSLRALASAYQTDHGQKSDSVHGLRLTSAQACDFFQSIATQANGVNQDYPNLDKRRTKQLPFAANVANILIEHTKASHVIFCTNGIRDGLIYKRLQESH